MTISKYFCFLGILGIEEGIELLKDFKHRLLETLHDAKFSHKVAKASQSAYSSRKLQLHPYQVNDLVSLDNVLFKYAIARHQQSSKLGARCFGPFEVQALIGKSAVRLKLPEGARVHLAVHVGHTRPYHTQPNNVAAEAFLRSPPVHWDDGQLECIAEDIIAHRKRGRIYQFLTLMKEAPWHEVKW